MPFFICPNCGHREISAERTAGFSTRPKGCSKCGFGFVFELLDDYYPAPNAAFFVCDQQARVIDAGRGSYELTGLTDEDVHGVPGSGRELPLKGAQTHADRYKSTLNSPLRRSS